MDSYKVPLTTRTTERSQNGKWFCGASSNCTNPFPDWSFVWILGAPRERLNQLVGSVLTDELEKRKVAFDEKFESSFGLQAKGFTSSQIEFAKAALSNMLGGMGYFFGQSVVQSAYNEHPVLYPEGPLFTAVPSRSFFPRGFLWDEGFHQLLISKWDTHLTQEVIAHWLDLINVEGWIPREQILDDEARSKVPSEFIVQHNENANPPTVFLALQELLEQLDAQPELSSSQTMIPFLRRLYPRLQIWFEWFNTTQPGIIANSYRWRGRDKDTNLFLNPKTLTSGLDDYPRASHPSADESMWTCIAGWPWPLASWQMWHKYLGNPTRCTKTPIVLSAIMIC